MSDQRIVLPGPLLLVGCGKMGGALLRGWLKRGVPGKDVFVVDLAPRDLEDVQARGVSIAAGKTVAYLKGKLGPGAQVVRSMPNTPAAVGRGMSVILKDSSIPAVT